MTMFVLYAAAFASSVEVEPSSVPSTTTNEAFVAPLPLDLVDPVVDRVRACLPEPTVAGAFYGTLELQIGAAIEVAASLPSDTSVAGALSACLASQELSLGPARGRYSAKATVSREVPLAPPEVTSAAARRDELLLVIDGCRELAAPSAGFFRLHFGPHDVSSEPQLWAVDVSPSFDPGLGAIARCVADRLGPHHARPAADLDGATITLPGPPQPRRRLGRRDHGPGQ